MRRIGYVLLIGGFLFFVLNATMSKQAALVVIWKQSDKLPKQETFTRKQVEDAIYEVAFDVRRMLSVIFVPAVIMLCGGVLLDRANEQKKQSNHAVKRSSQTPA